MPALKNIDLPQNTKSIGASAFVRCESITHFTIPSGVTTIGEGVFCECPSLTKIQVNDRNSYVTNDENGILFNKAKTELIHFPSACKINDYTVPASVSKIAYGAFGECPNLKSVTMQNGVHSIAAQAFYGYLVLESISVPQTVTQLCYENFNECRALQHIELPSSLTKIERNTLERCDRLEYVHIPSSVTSIGDDFLRETGAYICSNTASCYAKTFANNNNITFNTCNGHTPAQQPLVLLSSSPANGEMDVSFEDDLVLTFNQPIISHVGEVSATYDYEIAVRNYDTNETVYSTYSTFHVNAEQDGRSITLKNALRNLEEGQKYYIYVGTDCFTAKEDSSICFPGITNKDDFAFVCSDAEPLMTKITNKETVVFDDKLMPTGRMNVTFDPRYFKKPSSEYVDELADFCAQYLVLGYCYDEETTREYLRSIGFTDIRVDMQGFEDEINYFIASGKIKVNNQYYALVFLGLVGSYHRQWYSNFDPGTGSVHKGFNNAKNYIYASSEKGKLANYLKSIVADGYQTDKYHTKILIAGHSRGTVTANLVAAQLIKDQVFATADNVYTYAFATPSSTSLSERKNSEYKRIFNIINPTDFVAWVMPTAWDYGKYGTTYLLPSKTNDEDYSGYRAEMIYELK